MSTEQMEDRTSGSPANAFGNALVWKWSREMPRGLKTGFLTTMYACRAMCAASGQLRFSDGKAIRIQDIAKAAGCREQDARRFMEAGILAGLVSVIGERKRGKATLYALNSMCWPNWKAAEDYLRATARRRPEEEQTPEGSAHSGTNLEDGSSAHGGTNFEGEGTEEVPPTVALPGSSHGGSMGSVHSGPNNPGVFPGVPHDMADVVTQPQPVAREEAKSDSPKSATGNDLERLPFGRCETCARPLTRPNRTKCAAHADPVPGQRGKGRRTAVQSPLMTVVPAVATGASEAAPEPFRWQQEDPLAPVRVCGCGREFRSRDARTCQDCQYAAHREAHSA